MGNDFAVQRLARQPPAGRDHVDRDRESFLPRLEAKIAPIQPVGRTRSYNDGNSSGAW